MVDSGKKPAVGAVPTNDDSVNTPEESRNASVKVRTGWPHTSFIVDGVPEITSEGTMLTQAQYKAALEAAGPSAVPLEEVK